MESVSNLTHGNIYKEVNSEVHIGPVLWAENPRNIPYLLKLLHEVFNNSPQKTGFSQDIKERE